MARGFRAAWIVSVIVSVVIPWHNTLASQGKNPYFVSTPLPDCAAKSVLDGSCDPGKDRSGGPSKVRGYTSLPNPAAGQIISGKAADPLSMFARRPLEHFIIPAGGQFMDPLYNGLHYGVDYANPDDYLNGNPTYIYPISPGYVTTRSTCLMCFVDGDAQGRVQEELPKYNFGWGSMVLVEMPYSPDISIYVLYAHLNRDFVSLGSYVTPGQTIGVVGTTGFAQEIHLHLEIRFGPPGQFWNADFSQPDTLDRWLANVVVNPALVVFPENHPSLVTTMSEWLAYQHDGNTIP